MDNIMENNFENIYQGASFYIGCIGGSQWKSYYLITVSEGVVSQKIGIKLSLDEVQEIISAKGNEEVVSKIKLSKSGYIPIASDEKKTKLK